MHPSSTLTALALIFAFSITQVASALPKDWMGVEAGASFCKTLVSVKDNHYNPRWPMTVIKRTRANSAQDARPRWSADVAPVHGRFSILQANRVARGNLQHHLKIHYYARNWVGYLVVKASYVATKNGKPIEHLFAYDLEDAAGCVFSTQSDYPTYYINWSYQLTGHAMGRKPS
jgi:hypothetical protein